MVNRANEVLADFIHTPFGTCMRNWVVSIVLQFVWCRSKCSKDKVARLAFQPPPTSTFACIL